MAQPTMSPLDALRVGDILVIHPHEICPADGVVIKGHGSMDESYLTGEPYDMSKTPGAEVLSGAVNGETALTIRSTRLPIDSRYARIMHVMEQAQQQRPRLRRLGDQLGAWYTPAAVLIALAAWLFSGDKLRFLAVVVVATPCPLLLAIPVCIIASISLAARRGIVVRDPSVLERADTCRTMIFDKTGTLTYGLPRVTEQCVLAGSAPRSTRTSRRTRTLLQTSAGRSGAALRRVRRVSPLREAAEMSEKPGERFARNREWTQRLDRQPRRHRR